MSTTPSVGYSSNTQAHPVSVSVRDLQRMGLATSRSLVADLLSHGGSDAVGPRAGVFSEPAQNGSQQIVNLADHLLLISSDMHSMPQRMRWEYEMRGWLYLHFRLDGLSNEETPAGRCATIEGERFFLSASARQRPFARELIGEAWRTVGIMCRPSFAIRDLQIPGDELPVELRRFQAGEAEVDLWYTGQLTIEMKAAVQALLNPSVQTGLRTTYLRAKVVELVCLALERLRQPDQVERSIRLSDRDVQCLREVRRVLRDNNPAPSLSQLARCVGINRRKLALGFKQVYGVTVGEYHRELRLELARETLEKRAVPVAVVASAAGYCDAGSFSKAFRARYGCLPSEILSTARK